MKTQFARETDITRSWYVVDADNKILGRLATEIATILRGKNKPVYTPHVDCGDFVIVVNAEKVRVTGTKEKTKTYYRHSGYVGGLKSITLEKMREKTPDKIIRRAVWGMIPHNKLGRKIIRKMKIYTGPEHPHGAQQPTTILEDV